VDSSNVGHCFCFEVLSETLVSFTTSHLEMALGLLSMSFFSYLFFSEVVDFPAK